MAGIEGIGGKEAREQRGGNHPDMAVVTWDGAIRGYQRCALRDGNQLADVAKQVDKQDHQHYFRQPQADASL